MSGHDGGPAFPIYTPDMPVEGSPGASLRDYFAAAALTGLLANSRGIVKEADVHDLAPMCYALADTMLRARTPTDSEKEGGA